MPTALHSRHHVIETSACCRSVMMLRPAGTCVVGKCGYLQAAAVRRNEHVHETCDSVVKISYRAGKQQALACLVARRVMGALLGYEENLDRSMGRPMFVSYRVESPNLAHTASLRVRRGTLR